MISQKIRLVKGCFIEILNTFSCDCEGGELEVAAIFKARNVVISPCEQFLAECDCDGETLGTELVISSNCEKEDISFALDWVKAGWPDKDSFIADFQAFLVENDVYSLTSDCGCKDYDPTECECDTDTNGQENEICLEPPVTEVVRDLCQCEFGFQARYANWSSGPSITPPVGYITLRGNRETISPDLTVTVTNGATGQVYNALIQPNTPANGHDLIVETDATFPTAANGLPPIELRVEGTDIDGNVYRWNQIYGVGVNIYVGSNIAKGYIQNLQDGCPAGYEVELEPFFIGGSSLDATLLVNGIGAPHPVQETMNVTVTGEYNGIPLYADYVIKNVCRAMACTGFDFKLGQTSTTLVIQLTDPSDANLFNVPQTIEVVTATATETWNLVSSNSQLANYEGPALTGAGTVNFPFQYVGPEGVCKVVADLDFDFTPPAATCANPQYVFETIPQSPDGDGLDLNGLGDYAISNGPATQWVIAKLNAGFEYVFLMAESPINGNKVWLKMIAGDAVITGPTVVNVIDTNVNNTYGLCGKSEYASYWDYAILNGAHPDSFMGGGGYDVALTNDVDIQGGFMPAPAFYANMQFYYGFAVKVS